jgi:hypothetical protein
MELKSQITAGEGAPGSTKGGKHVVNVYAFASDWVNGAFLQVYV